MPLRPKPPLHFADWLTAERLASHGHTEYLNGEVFTSAGGSEVHNLIAANVFGELRNCFKGRPCYVYNCDMKVWIASANLGAYPDVMAVCGERLFWDEHRDVITNPTLVVEVLSVGTETYDRGKKFACYRTIPSLRAYLLLSQQRVHAELFLHQSDGDWRLRTYSDPHDCIHLPPLDAVVSLAEVYDKVEFTPGIASQRIEAT